MNVYDLSHELSGEFNENSIRDYCPNGLQISTRNPIKKIAIGVTASMELIDASIEWGADAIFVHHGLFWGNEVRIERWLYDRVEKLIKNSIGVFSYHLPLDFHPVLGTTANLARYLSIDKISEFGLHGGRNLGIIGTVNYTFSELLKRLETDGIKPLKVYSYGPDEILKTGVIAGDGIGYIDEALKQGVDTFITGEFDGPSQYICREAGINLVAMGHEQSESFFMSAIKDFLTKNFNFECKCFSFDYAA
ncbi:MAG: Nif3-like dinuclear metal center hexameric protein [Deltaproteobacteria bacterium]|nr:Nif3-like dinuclear metal center hexameric protein [Deltaproteobacteria bacterium]